MALRAKFDVKRFWHDRGFRITQEVSAVAEAIGRPPLEVALAWLLGDRRVSSVIVGARTAEQIRQNAAAGDLDLDDAMRRRLDEVAAFEPGYPESWAQMNADPQFTDVDS
jgi:aryl-alcohol dehydrogenase-like predicted oxidoreductase